MKKEEFLQVFQETIQPTYQQDILKIRKAYSYETSALIVAFITSASIWLFLTLFLGAWSYVVIPFVVYLIFSTFLKRAERKFKKTGFSYKETLSQASHVKQRFYNDCLSYISPSLRYSFEKGITKSDFQEYGIIHESFIDKFKSSDQIEGDIRGRRYRISQVDIRHDNTDSKGKTQQEIVFRGIVMETKIPIDKSFILTNYQTQTNYAIQADSLFHSKTSDLSPLTFSHFQFDSLFKSATNNPILAQSLLDPYQLDSLIEELNQYVPGSHFAISKGKLILVIPRKRAFDLYGPKHIEGEMVWKEFSKIYRYATFIENLELDERASEVSVQ